MCYASPAKAKLRIGIMFSCSVLLLKEFGGLYEVVTCEMVVYNFLLNGIDGDWLAISLLKTGFLIVTDLLRGVTLKMCCYVCPAKVK